MSSSAYYFKDGWDANKVWSNYDMILDAWLEPWKYIAPIVIGVFSLLYIASIFMYMWTNAKLPGSNTIYLFMNLTFTTVLQVLSGICLTVYVYDGENNWSLRLSTFSEVMSTYWLIIYVSSVSFSSLKRPCTRDSLYQWGILILVIAGLILSSVGIWNIGLRILFKFGSCFLLAGALGSLALTVITNSMFVRNYSSKCFVVVILAAIFVVVNPIYYVYLIFSYKAYVIQAHYGFYIGLNWVPKILAMVLCQQFLIKLKHVHLFNYDDQFDRKFSV